MPVEIVIPSTGESITEIRLGQWLKQDGDWVNQDESLVEIESDKVTQELPAPAAGALKITEAEGADLPIGASIGSIDTEAAKPAVAEPTAPSTPETPAVSETATPIAPQATRVEMATESAAASTPVEPPRWPERSPRTGGSNSRAYTDPERRVGS